MKKIKMILAVIIISINFIACESSTIEEGQSLEEFATEGDTGEVKGDRTDDDDESTDDDDLTGDNDPNTTL